MSAPASNHRFASPDVQGPPPHPEHQDHDQQREASDSEDIDLDEIMVLGGESRHGDWGTRFTYIALTAVVRGRLPIAGWGESDYAYLAMLARALDAGLLPLEALVWDPAAGWSRQRAVATRAMSAHVASEWRRAAESNDEDVECYVANDNVHLAEIFRLRDRDNPFLAAVDESGTVG